MGFVRRVTVLIGIAPMLLAAQAHGATTVGATAPAVGATYSQCTTPTIYLQYQTQLANLYSLTASGVLTSWSIRVPANSGDSLKLKVLTPTNRPGKQWQVARTSALATTGTAADLYTLPTRL